jgi:hypothetical protein
MIAFDAKTSVEENKSATSVPIILTIGNSPIGGRPANPHAALVCVICAMNVTLPGGQKNLQNECVTAAKSILNTAAHHLHLSFGYFGSGHGNDGQHPPPI